MLLTEIDMKPEQITYEKFCQIATKMLENEEKLTVRAVHGRLGGSFSKISTYLKQFEQERVYMSASRRNDVSDSLRQAMLAEIGMAVEETKTMLEKQLRQVTGQLDEANEQLSALEVVIVELQNEAADTKEKLAISKKNIDDLHSEQKNTLAQLETAQKEKVLAITEAAKFNLQLERSDKDNAEFKVVIKELQGKLDKLNGEKFEAEKRAAVAEAKFQQVINK